MIDPDEEMINYHILEFFFHRDFSPSPNGFPGVSLNSSPCVCGGKFSLCALGMILSVRRRFAVAAGEVVSDCKSLLSSQFFGCFAHCLSLWQISAPSGTWLVSCSGRDRSRSCSCSRSRGRS